MAYDGYNLELWRREQGMSLAAAAALLGVSAPCLWTLEKGTSSPSWRVLEQILVVTGLPVSAFSSYAELDSGLCLPKA